MEPVMESMFSRRRSSLSWMMLAMVGLGSVVGSPLRTTADVAETSKPRFRSALPEVRATTKWTPSIGDTWQIVLLNPVKITQKAPSPNADVWTLDMYDNDASTFKALHAAGKKVICYFSAGTREDWRDDADLFQAADVGAPLKDWKGENWLNTRSAAVRKIMAGRIKYASQKGCDAIDPDNIDPYDYNTGFKLTQANQIDYIKFLSNTAASYKMSMGLKNGVDIISKVLSYVAFATVEQCSEYSECQAYAPFIKAGKPVFQIEYPEAPDQISTSAVKELCPTSDKASENYQFTTIIKKSNLDGWVRYCGGTKTYTTTAAT
ncbi:hypothetical protein G7Z17_g11601 [Cylindrodendrum hubeiense]|uniref:alpha-galactosidase n=1 Tax=Cylindrodendrum hubeiense TaxID=595255 RepID=A0A9P5GZX3_9HYPO|nr:hypothetical protein G7Z17_g11601 [Cylindrodendrum hubeiense]